MTAGLAIGLRHGLQSAGPHAALGHPVLEWAIALVFVGIGVAVPVLALVVERRRCRAASLDRASLDRAWAGVEEGLLPADPKEDQNDGDPIRAAHEVWLGCSRCGCRHPTREHCPSPEEVALRRAEDIARLRERIGSRASAESHEVALLDKPLSAPRAGRRSDPEDGSVNACGRPACEPSQSAADGNAAAQARLFPDEFREATIAIDQSAHSSLPPLVCRGWELGAFHVRQVTDFWVVTHIRTGLRVPYVFYTKDDVIGFVREVAALKGDWSDLRAEDFREILMPLIERHNGEVQFIWPNEGAA